MAITEANPIAIGAPTGAPSESAAVGAPMRALDFIPGPPPDTLPIPWTQQHQGNWCWAACAQMVYGFRGTPISQEELAQRILAGRCPNPNLDCGVPKETVSAIYGGAVGLPALPYVGYSGPLAKPWFPRDLQQWRYPIEIWWTSKDERSAHVVLIVGISTLNGVDYAWVNNPQPSWAGIQPMRYEALLDASGYGTWCFSWAV